MFTSYDLQLLSIREYSGKTQAQQREMLPLDPGIYIWTVDLGTLLNNTHAPETAEPAGSLFERLQGRVKPVDHSVSARFGSYHRATLRLEPLSLTEATRQRVDQLEEDHNDSLEWSLMCGSLFQRPLYVGKAICLRRRIRDHLRGGSQLRRYLQTVGLEPDDCMVTLACLRDPDDPYGVGLDSLDEDGNDVGGDDEDEDLPDDAEPAVVRIDSLVRLAESLTIRLSQPLLNRKQD